MEIPELIQIEMKISGNPRTSVADLTGRFPSCELRTPKKTFLENEGLFSFTRFLGLVDSFPMFVFVDLLEVVLAVMFDNGTLDVAVAPEFLTLAAAAAAVRLLVTRSRS